MPEEPPPVDPEMSQPIEPIELSLYQAARDPVGALAQRFAMDA